MNRVIALALLLCIVGASALQKPLHSRFKTSATNATKLALVEEADPCDGICCGDYGHCELGECVCQDGWLGELCDRGDPCYEKDCGPNGSCYDNGVTGTCYCAPGYSGRACEFKDAECVGDWTEWDQCTVTCGGGEQAKTFVHSTFQSGYGCDCEFPHGETRVQPCNTHHCPIDCVSRYGDWGSCSQTCEAGTRTRSLIVEVEAQYGGQACPPETETEACYDRECPIDCVGEWELWGTCSTTCDEGIQFRTFRVSVPAQYDGKECEYADGTEQDQKCNTADEDRCPIHCEGKFGDFTACSVTCEEGTKSRVFSHDVVAEWGGDACEFEDGYVDVETCNLGGCPVDCVGAWSDYDECSRSCGPDGTQDRVYQVSVHAEFGGASCPHADGKGETRECNRWECPDLCDGVCCENGHCEEGTCICYYGWTGVLCDEEDTNAAAPVPTSD